MSLIHPYFALLATAISLSAFFMGIRHFLATRKGRSVAFNRNKHIRLGAAGLVMLVLAAAGGFVMADRLNIDMNLLHVFGGLAIVALACASGVSGWLLRKPSTHRAMLKTTHRSVGILLILACLNQLATGYKVFFM